MLRVNVIQPSIAPKINKLLHIKLISIDSTNETFLFNIDLKCSQVFSVFTKTRNDQTENDIHQNLIHHQIECYGPEGLSVVCAIIFTRVSHKTSGETQTIVCQTRKCLILKILYLHK